VGALPAGRSRQWRLGGCGLGSVAGSVLCTPVPRTQRLRRRPALRLQGCPLGPKVASHRPDRAGRRRRIVPFVPRQGPTLNLFERRASFTRPGRERESGDASWDRNDPAAARNRFGVRLLVERQALEFKVGARTRVFGVFSLFGCRRRLFSEIAGGSRRGGRGGARGRGCGSGCWPIAQTLERLPGCPRVFGGAPGLPSPRRSDRLSRGRAAAAEAGGVRPFVEESWWGLTPVECAARKRGLEERARKQGPSQQRLGIHPAKALTRRAGALRRGKVVNRVPARDAGGVRRAATGPSPDQSCRRGPPHVCRKQLHGRNTDKAWWTTTAMC